MEKQIEDFYRSLRGRRVAFIGTGVTNQQCIELFARCGAQITLCDKKPDIDAFGPYAQALRKLDIRFSLGEHYLDGLAGQVPWSPARWNCSLISAPAPSWL